MEIPDATLCLVGAGLAHIRDELIQRWMGGMDDFQKFSDSAFAKVYKVYTLRQTDMAIENYQFFNRE